MPRLRPPPQRLFSGPAGRPIDGGNRDDHLVKCPGCGAMVDMRDLGQVFQHAGKLPHEATEPKEPGTMAGPGEVINLESD